MTFNNKFHGIDHAAVVRDLLSRKTTVQQLCLDLGLSKKSLIGHLYRRGFNYDEYQWTTLGPIKKDDASAWEFLKQHYDDGKTITELAGIIGFTEPVVDRVFDRFGWAKRPISEVFCKPARKRVDAYREKYGVGHHPSGRKKAVEATRLTLCRKNEPEVISWLGEAGFKLMEKYRGRNTNGGTYPRYQIKHNECGTVFDGTLRQEPRCPLCRPLKTKSSKEEAQYTRILRGLGLDVITSSRRVVRSMFGHQWYELDMYSPAMKLGFEHNGLYYHSLREHPKTLFASQKDPMYHAKKSASALCAGVGLIHLWAHDDRSISESLIKKAVGRVASVDAKDLSVSEIDSEEAKRFFGSTHLRGQHDQAERTICLTDSGRTLAAASVRVVGDVIEILRFSTAKETDVVGGIVRLVDGIRSAYPKARRVVTYKNRDWAPIPDQTDFAKAGFVFEKDVGPSEYWTDYKRVWREKPAGVSKVYPFYTSGNLLFTKELHS